MIGHEIRLTTISIAFASSRRRTAARRPAARSANGRAARKRRRIARPKGREREKEYWRFCLEHVREYNQSYNFFAGMNDDAVLAYQKDALTGHRPTWKMGTGKGDVRPDLARFRHRWDPFGLFGRAPARNRRARAETRVIRNAERKALETLGLEVSATAAQVKTRFKDLVKRHHPDANGGDRSTEDRLVEIIQAYNYLKSVGFG